MRVVPRICAYPSRENGFCRFPGRFLFVKRKYIDKRRRFDLKEMLEKIKAEAAARLSEKNADPEALRVQYLGKKGELTSRASAAWGSSPPRRRPKIGAAGKRGSRGLYREPDRGARRRRRTRLRLRRSSRQRRWMSPCPPSLRSVGSRHPLSMVQTELEGHFHRSRF